MANGTHQDRCRNKPKKLPRPSSGFAIGGYRSKTLQNYLGPVRTASVTQVRQPIYTRSAGRYLRYESELRELFQRIAPERDKDR